MTKFLIALLMVSSVGLCQDWISEVSVPVLPESADMPMPPSPLESLMQRMEQAIADAKAATEAAKLVTASPMKFDFDADARLSALELAVEKLAARKEWTEGEIRTLAKGEAEKLMQATVKTPSGEVREVGASSMQVSVDGYSGTFEVKDGEKIIAVNGQPIVHRAVVSERVMVDSQPVVVQSMMATTQSVQMQSVPQRQGVVRFWSMRNQQCVGGNCPK